MTVERETPNYAPVYWSKIPKIPAFLMRHVKQIRADGWLVLMRNIVTLLSLLPALPVVILIRLLRPFFVIRLGKLRSNGIGHFAANTEVYLCECDAGINRPQKPFIDIWFNTPIVSNMQLNKMWKRTLNVLPAVIIRPLYLLNLLLPGGRAHIIFCNDCQRDVNNVLERFSPHLSFLPHEEAQGQSSLREMGVPEGHPFVCFHARDPVYLEKLYPNFNTRYHDYRNSNINNCVLAAEELSIRGYYTIRMGSLVKDDLKFSNPKIIDYATNGHWSEFMDIYLGARCTFFISSGSGIDAIPEIFRRLHIFVNIVPVERAHSWNSRHLFITKKHWLRDEHRFMTFHEIIKSGAGRFLRTQQFEAMGIELIENTPEEIAALAIEMDERLKGTWQTEKEDDELQQRFWSLFPKSELHGVIKSRIGTEFLRAYLDLL